MPTLLQALNNGFEGIIWVLRTQRNMRVHFLAGAAALVLAVVLGVSRVDLLAVILAIALVLVAEMINTALEAAVDLAQPDPHPLAKVAKDVAAGGVLIAAACSLAIGYLVFADRLSHPSGHAIHRVRSSSPDLTLIALLLVVLTRDRRQGHLAPRDAAERRTALRPRRGRVRRASRRSCSRPATARTTC